MWIHSEESKLKSLNKLEQVGGDLLINGSNISDLGNLKKVNGKVNLRDTNVIGLNNLKYIGGDLYLPKRLEELDLEGIEVKGKIRYWNDKKTSKIEILNKELQTDFQPYFSDIHKNELIQKKRVLSGEFLTNKCFKLSEYNGYIIDNYKEFISFVDLEIDNLYERNYSFYKSLYGEIKSTKEINNEFPKVKVDKRIDYDIYNKKIRKLSNEIISKERNNSPFSIYTDKLKTFKNR